MKKIISFLLAILLLATAKPIFAVQFKNGNDISYPKNEKVDETLFLAGNNINFDSTLTGDLYCAGQNITINGNIKGDVICAGQSIKITGVIDGDIRVISQAVDIEGQVSRNVSTISQKLTFGPKSSVKGDILFGGQTVDLSGVAGRDLSGMGQNVVVSGSLLRNAIVTVSNMQVLDTAKVGGSLDYYVDQTDTASQVNIAPNSIKGAVRKHEIVRPQTNRMKDNVQQKIKAVKPGLELFGKVMGIISFTLLTFILIYFNRSRTDKILSTIKQKPVVSGLVGLAVLLVTPMALLILCATVVGLPVALLLFLVYMVTLIVSSLYATLIIGSFILGKMYNGKSFSIYLAAFVGCLVVGLLSIVPIIGWLMMLVIFLMGLGASFLAFLPEK